MITVFGIPNCDKIRKTLSWLDTHSVEHQFVDLKKSPLEADELDVIVTQIGLDTILNRRGTTWRKLGLADKALSDKELQDVLLQNQSMIIRPLIEKDGVFLAGYDEDAFSSFLEIEE